MEKNEMNELVAVRLPFHHPASVVQISPMSGVYATDKYLEDPHGFSGRVLGFWYTQLGNYLMCETYQHVHAAQELHEFYLWYRGLKEHRLRAQVLLTLYRTGSVEQAKAVADR